MIQTPVREIPQPITTPTQPATPRIVDQPQPANPFALYQTRAAAVAPQSVQWLWQNRIPATGITVIDGDHGLGKSLLALQIAAHVSSGTPMPDGTPTIQGGVVIITPHESPVQLQHLASLGADLEHIQFLTYVHDPNQQPYTEFFFPTSDHRPFSLPEDLPRLIEAIEHVNARLVILDPFIYLLSRHQRHTKLRLFHMLTELHQFLTERDIACLLLRSCRAKGGHAQPSTLEKSDHFTSTATSHLLLAPDPMQRGQILLSHAINRHGSLAQTLTLKIQPLPNRPDLAYITNLGPHPLTADQLLTQRPDSLHRYLLSQQILTLLNQSPTPIHSSTLHAHFLHSSLFQMHHTLKDLLLTGQIQRPSHGFYSSNTSASKLNQSAATSPDPKLATPTATTSNSKLNQSAAITPPSKLNQSAAITLPSKLKPPAAITSSPKLNSPAATSPDPRLATPAATTSDPKNSHSHKKHASKRPKPHGRPR